MTQYSIKLADLSDDIATRAGYSPTTDQLTLSATIGLLIKVALSLLGIIFLVLTVYAGYLWMTARGNEANVEKAQEILKTSVLGLLVILASYSITYFVMTYAFQATF